MLTRLAIALACLAAPAAAQDTLILSPCQSEKSPATEPEMAEFLAGTWQMSAAGTGFTTGTNIMAVTLRADPGSGRLMMEGGGVSAPLHPVGLARDIGADAPASPDFDIAVETMTPGALSADDIALATGCERPCAIGGLLAAARSAAGGRSCSWIVAWRRATWPTAPAAAAA